MGGEFIKQKKLCAKVQWQGNLACSTSEASMQRERGHMT